MSLVELRKLSEKLDKVEEHLFHEQWLVQLILDSSAERIWLKDFEHRFIRVNRAAYIRYGFTSPDQMLGKTDFDLLGEETARAGKENEEQVIQGKPLTGFLVVEHWPGGRTTYSVVSKRLLYSPNGAPFAILGRGLDITPIVHTLYSGDYIDARS